MKCINIIKKGKGKNNSSCNDDWKNLIKIIYFVNKDVGTSRNNECQKDSNATKAGNVTTMDFS